MNQSRWRLPMVAILGAVAIALLFGGPLRRLEWIPYDAYWRWIQPIEDAPPVVVVAVDSASVNQLGAPPWDAATALDLLTTISKGQPAAILYAIPTRDEPLPDVPKPLTDNLRRQLVLGELLVDDANRSIQWELQPLAPSLAPLAAGSGVVRLEYDADGVYRHLNMTYDVGGVSTPSAVAVALRVARGSALH
ncbi:MAG: CHASE2 domain-containing protein, partial [Candidatus Poribacteria bacterium]|nr:CHASE2 domain-containing protein [Candidatus Poribacteria bacterium]